MFNFKTRYYALLHDMMMVVIAWLIAFWFLSLIGHIPASKLILAIQALPLVVMVQAIAFLKCGLYRGFWRYVSVPDIIRIFKAVIIGVTATTFAWFFINHLQGVPRSVLPLYALLLAGLITIPRMVYRWYQEKRGRRIEERILIVGAGEAGHLLVRDLIRNTQYGYQPVAFVDDDNNKIGKEIYGVRVIGIIDDIPKIVKLKHISKILIAIPSASGRKMRRIVELCKVAKIDYRTLPSLTNIASGDVSVTQLHEVSLDDLLGRDPVKMDWQRLHQGMHGKTVLVTGGGGSIGREICLKLATLPVSKVIVVENCEFNLYSLHQQWHNESHSVPLIVYLQDCTNRAELLNIMQTHKPDMIFHAAALKHVPLLEHQVHAAIHNNIIGTQTVAEVAKACDVEKFILISTDKAVMPESVMGKTKRVAELLCEWMNAHSDTTKFTTVRFGNVLGSSGSVVPLFKKQIAQGGPVTVTHPDMQRYFMTVSEASLLILQSAIIGEGGEIFVLDMGEAVSIRFLAEQMILLTGKTPGEDIEIVYTGMRKGEKLHESLFYSFENIIKTEQDKILSATHKKFDYQQFIVILNELIQIKSFTNEKQANLLLDSIISLLNDQESTNEVELFAQTTTVSTI